MNTEPRCHKEVAGLLESGGYIHVLNTTIVPPGADGTWVVEEVSVDYARGLVRSRGSFVFSHVGHQATAEAASEVLGVKVSLDRTPWKGHGIGLVLQLKGRLPEGQILDRAQLEKMGYALRVLFRKPTFLIGRNLELGNALGPWEELGRSDSFADACTRARAIAVEQNIDSKSGGVVMVWAEGTCPRWGCTSDEGDMRGGEFLREVTTGGSIVGRNEPPLDYMSHVRVYPYSPTSVALQVRAQAKDGRAGKQRQVHLTALLKNAELVALRDHLSALIRERGAELVQG